MEYEIVEMESKLFAGVAAVTNNEASDMSTKIGGLWQKLYSGVAQSMKGRTNAKAVGLYCDYQLNGDYTVLAGCEVSPASKEALAKAGLVTKEVPAGKFAKFEIHGNVQSAVAQAWGEIWKLPLQRTFAGDYEEYQEDCAGGNGTILIYIAIK